jgi:hypothetical protein
MFWDEDYYGEYGDDHEAAVGITTLYHVGIIRVYIPPQF